MKRLLLIGLLTGSGACLAAAGSLARFQTAFGTLEVELYDTDKPATVANFKRYVEAGLYQNNFIHRCVPGFVAQGGGFYTTTPLATNNFTQFYSVPSFGPLTNEYSVGTRRSNTYGTIAMAKVGGDPDSATSQWFFNLANNSTNLDNQNGGFTVFGRVVRGTNALNNFNALGYGYYLQNLSWYYGTNTSLGQLFTSLPVSYQGFFVPWYSDLIYVGVSLLKADIRPALGGGCEIGWTSSADVTNRVMFATNLPPVWQTLAVTNGTGNRITITDSAPGPRRFYRVEVLY